MTENEKGRWDKVRGVYEIISRLRGESGCPWDRKQTPESVQTYLIEEAHEAASAIRSRRPEEAAEELGDLLFMVFFMIHLYEEKKDFRLEDVCDGICEKMIRRHPHVFGNVDIASVQDVKDNWEKIKKAENASAGKPASRVPESLPALMRAYRILSRVPDGEKPGLGDLDAQARALSEKGRKLCGGIGGDMPVESRDFGDMLLTLVNMARLKGFRAEDCLHEAINRLDNASPRADH